MSFPDPLIPTPSLSNYMIDYSNYSNIDTIPINQPCIYSILFSLLIYPFIHPPIQSSHQSTHQSIHEHKSIHVAIHPFIHVTYPSTYPLIYAILSIDRLRPLIILLGVYYRTSTHQYISTNL